MQTAPSAVIDSHFASIVGQDDAKSRLKDIMAGPLVEDGFMAPTLLYAPPGYGKTHFVEACKRIAKALMPERKTVSFKSGDEMGTVNIFFEDVLIPHVEGKEMIMFVDEFHKADAGVRSLVHRMLEITSRRESKTVTKGKYEVTINPYMHGFVLATNRIDLLDPALVSRLERVNLSQYSDCEMETMLFNELKNHKIIFNDNTLRKIAECNRGNARDIIKWSNMIRRYVAIESKKSINKEDVATLLRKAQVYPLGVTQNELQTLIHLYQSGPLQLRMLANRNGCSSSEQNCNESYLFKCGLITVEVLRKLTPKGVEYLKELMADKFIDPIEKNAGGAEIQ